MTLMDTFTDLVTGIALESWNIFLDTAPYLFFGFGVAGILHIFIPDDKIINYLGATAGIISNLLVEDKQDRKIRYVYGGDKHSVYSRYLLIYRRKYVEQINSDDIGAGSSIHSVWIG